MREQAHLIQGEVIRLMEDLGRLDDRVQKLQGHFAAAQRDVEQIATSAGKLAKRGQKIEAMEFEASEAAAEQGPPVRSVESRTGQLKLRVVDED
jgi:DNA recombination protein RmuC